MKGDMALEYPFKMFLYIVIILVVIGLIVTFRNQILGALNLCQFLPRGCEENEECFTIEATEPTVNEAVLSKYCIACWGKTGKKEYKKDCLCYVIKGSFSPTVSFQNENCELKCSKDATSLTFSYDHTLKEVYIKC